MNQTEIKALAWLSHLVGDEVKVIVRGKLYPRFVTTDGRAFHAKRLYGHSIIFSDAEVEGLHGQDVSIVVFNSGNAPLFSFPFREIDFNSNKWGNVDIRVVPWREMLRQRLGRPSASKRKGASQKP